MRLSKCVRPVYGVVQRRLRVNCQHCFSECVNSVMMCRRARYQSEAQTELVFGLQRRARDEGLVFVAPYDDPLTVAGQGTIGTEILRQVRRRAAC